MTTLASELELSDLTWVDEPGVSWQAQREACDVAAEEHWLTRNMFGYTVLRYEDVVAMLRDKRWHSASGQMLELAGIDNPEWTARQRQ
jgi:hypothetical protein